MKVLNFGSLNLDYVYRISHIVKPGETITSKSLETFSGGKGLNQSIAMAKAGIEVYHAGLIGKDGMQLLDTCKANNIHTDFIEVTDEKTGNAMIQVDEAAENSIILFPGANRKNHKEFVDAVLSHFGQGDLLVLQNEINLNEYMIDQAYQKGMQIAMNPSPFDQNVVKCALDKVTYFFINEIEGEMMTGEKNPEKVLEILSKKYPEGKIILTLGKRGAWYQNRNKRCFQRIFPVKAVDTTAAGDTFTGFFLKMMQSGASEEEALRIASLASSITVSRKGASDSIPSMKEVEASPLF